MSLVLPIFPEMKHLELSDREMIERYVEQFPPYSDFNFTSLFCWDTENTVRVAELNGNLIVKFQDYTEDDMFYSLLGENRLRETIDSVLEYARKEDIYDLKLIPEFVVKNLKRKKGLAITEDRDHRDYILSVEDHVRQEGTKFHAKRRKIRRFLEEHGDDLDMRILALGEEQVRRDVLKVFDNWAESQNRHDHEVASERQAIERLLNHYHDMAITPFGKYHGRNLVGFLFIEIVGNDYAIGHFEKADAEKDGAFQYLQHQILLYLYDRGVKFYNIEQDLGLEGLRRSKKAMNPVHFLKKYTIKRV